MDDYLGAIVELKDDEWTPEGRRYPAGSTFIVHGHWRGRLTLSQRDGTLGGEGAIALGQVLRSDVRILAWRLA